MSNTHDNVMAEWNTTNWRKLEKIVFKLQKRIFKASERGDIKAVRRLQKTLMCSRSAKMLAVRQVTQDNQGKKTAGVDGVKSLTPPQRLKLVKNLSIKQQVRPTRRVWIPKPGTEEKRPLGIPTMHDRALQCLIKLALEAEWEARFEPNSFGFRPGRSSHDAIEAIHTVIAQKAKYVLDADIAKCFDRINHNALLKKLNTFPTLRRLIKMWLKAGVMDGGKMFPTDEGTPQGGVISPLLANIALHGLENRLKQFASSLPGRKKDNINALTIVRYADDFVVIHPDISVITRVKQIVTQWLNGMGLEMSEKKTRITHTLIKVENQSPGFNFLGFNIRQYPVGKTHTGKVQGKLLGFKTLIKPSEKKIQLHVRSIGEIIASHKTAKQEALIAHLNPVIVGWSNYYSTVVSKRTFNTCDNHLYSQLKSWAERRHPNKNSSWIADKYWQTVGERNWAFGASNGEEILLLAEHKKTPIVRHIKVKGNYSPFNGDWAYWSARRGTHPETPTRVARLMKKQKGMCPYCNLYIRSEDLIEVDHIIPRSQGGKDIYSNLQLLHRHCHDIKTAMDIKSLVGSTHIKGQNTEEPDDAKVSRPVLKTSGSREGIA